MRLVFHVAIAARANRCVQRQVIASFRRVAACNAFEIGRPGKGGAMQQAGHGDHRRLVIEAVGGAGGGVQQARGGQTQ
ncbi:conserved hypothetical protein [Ricinus communis]|uniref:Uncharacterized protein n=1 Tax=Ricinus communis TaxID=3988 RepID=B9THA9_RICCO|nr:conserved hypothetical protein [Ricinus communis]